MRNVVIRIWNVGCLTKDLLYAFVFKRLSVLMHLISLFIVLLYLWQINTLFSLTLLKKIKLETKAFIPASQTEYLTIDIVIHLSVFSKLRSEYYKKLYALNSTRSDFTRKVLIFRSLIFDNMILIGTWLKL